jgi:hypothetical protein
MGSFYFCQRLIFLYGFWWMWCTECMAGTASLLSLVKTFDSLLAVYEGFCNLKQVAFFFSLLFPNQQFSLSIFKCLEWGVFLLDF